MGLAALQQFPFREGPRFYNIFSFSTSICSIRLYPITAARSHHVFGVQSVMPQMREKAPRLHSRVSMSAEAARRPELQALDDGQTPIEAVRTGKSCDDIYCHMNVAQQLIVQSQIWHAVDIMDMEQIEENHAQRPENSRMERARIIQTHGRDESAETPLISNLTRTYPTGGLDAPEANTEANMFLLRALGHPSKAQKRPTEFAQLSRST